MKKIFFALLLITSVACRKDPPPPETVSVSSVTLNQTSVTLSVGETVKLAATVSPSNATDKTITWSSSNTSVATVTNGEVKAVAAGSATITAKAGNVRAECQITVNSVSVPVTSIKLNKTSVTLDPGETVELTATISPADATDKNIKWSSSNRSIAVVDEGKVTAVASGTATIVAKVGEVKAECLVTVGSVEVTSITLDKTSVALFIGNTVTLTATVAPENATDKVVKWSSSNTRIATVDNYGTVIAAAIGTTTVIARAGDLSAECLVAVLPRSISFSETSITMNLGEQLFIASYLLPSDVPYSALTWTSSNPDVVSVDNGVLSALQKGKATITAQSDNGLRATCDIFVVGGPGSGGSEGTGEVEW